DYGYGISTDQNGNVYVSGMTNSITAIATSGSHQSTFGGNYDAFIAKFISCYPSYDTISITTCDSFIFNGQTLFNTGTYFDTIMNVNGCDSFITLFLNFYPNPQAGFSINDTAQCLTNNNFIFTNTSTIQNDSISYYLWKFGDNDTLNFENSIHSYQSADTFDAKLITTSQHGCKDSISKKLIVYPQPNASFAINDTNQCLASNSFYVLDNSTIGSGSYTRYWHYKSIDTSGINFFTVNYSTADTFSIKLKTISNFGCSDSISRQVAVVTPPNIITQSIGDTLCIGDSTALFVSAIGALPLTFQWKKNGQVISNATDSFYYISNAVATDSGIYRCIVSNDCGTDSTEIMKLRINQKPHLIIIDSLSSTEKLEIEWQKCYGGTKYDNSYNLIQISSNNYMFTATTASNDYDVSGNHGSFDYWVVEVNDTGNIIWQKCYGSFNQDGVAEILELNENNIFVTGYVGSNSGNVSGYNGGAHDVWSILLDNTANIQWQKCIGGTSWDDASCVAKINNYSIVVGGRTYSTNGNFIGNHGGYDMLIFKTDIGGNVKWLKCIGGSINELCNDILVKGNYIYCVGRTTSSNGDIDTNYGYNDIVIVKLDTNGNMIWTKTYGGNLFDEASSICSSEDDLVITGYTSSNNSFIDNSKGSNDAFIIKIDTGGNILWKKRYGGSSNDGGHSILQTNDNGFLVSGYSNSNDHDVGNNNGNSDVWVFKVNNNGEIIWEINLGGSLSDAGFVAPSYAIQNSAGDYLILSGTKSNDIDVSGNHGNSDIWLVKLNEPFKVEICANDSFILKTSSIGTKPIYYQWFKDSVAITGADSTDLIIPNTNLSDSGYYYCEASNMCGTYKLTQVKLVIQPNPNTNFSINDSEQCFNENYFQFFNNSSIINNDSIYNIWDLGDNTIDTSKTYAHTYSSFDTFN
ncbi:MAG: immunoglobulin domain-containing protein, partial [Bacteroidota bacterium]|nr:immunoglobulin domain-containing protein [Bacteroidota bacterium]